MALLPPTISFFLLLFIASILIIKFGVRSIPEGQSSLVLRLGKYSRTLTPGVHVTIPGIERIHVPLGLMTINDDGEQVPLSSNKGLITMKEFLLDPPPHDMICSDNSIVNVDSLAYLRISSPHRAAFGVENLGDAFIKLVETVLRQEVGKLNADEVIHSRDVIGSKLQQALTIAAEPWGTTVIRVEIQDITFKRELQEALSKAREEELAGRARVVAAERSRDAMIAKAEGEKKAVELAAEAELAMAQAKAQAEFLHESRRREGEAQGLKAITEALQQQPEALLKLEAIKQQPEIAKGLAASNGLLVVPSDVAGLIGATATMLKSFEAIKSSDKT
ncbi:MAG: SPFH/Band 7/PHB domain protein [Flavobacteriales bacterium]|nr:SPFH/Band 7/PHB domain protein [Flavobacteriales bacterium]